MKAIVLATALGLNAQGAPMICVSAPLEPMKDVAFLSHCCIQPKGQQCCSKSLDDAGNPAGCGCK